MQTLIAAVLIATLVLFIVGMMSATGMRLDL